MRRVVTGGDLSQRAMRPPDLLNAYLELVEADVRSLRLLEGAAAERGCPACGGAGVEAFRRLGFGYRRCRGCASLFVSTLPDRRDFDRYYRQGKAERFWRDSVLPATAGVRSRHALSPRAHWVATTAAARLGGGLALGDLGSRDPRILEFLATSPAFARRTAIADGDDAGTFDVVLAFETLERAPDLDGALGRARRLLRADGLLFASTLSGSGFEVRMLAGRMRSLVPPIHLQLLSREGWAGALGRAGFELLEYSTPGALDVQAVAEACRQDPTIELPPIVGELVRHDDEEVTHAFQEVLQQAGLSSHVQFVAVAANTPQELR